MQNHHLECSISGYFINYINNIFVSKIFDGLDLFLPLVIQGAYINLDWHSVTNDRL